MSQTNSISWLPEDLTGKATTNYVQNEVHKAETTGALTRFVIIPAEGAFYDTDNLKVVYHTQTRETTLIRNNDYRLVGIDIGRTKISSAQGGVYHFIMITTVFNYDPNSYITVSYQAFGGYLSAKAYSELLTKVEELEDKLEQDGIITKDNIASNETIARIASQLQSLCIRLDYAPSVAYLMRTSSGKSTNWYTIAVSKEAYDATLDFTKPSTLQGHATFLIESKFLNMKVSLAYDLSQRDPNTTGVFNGTVIPTVLFQEIFGYDYTTKMNDLIYFSEHRTYIPKFRMCFNTDTTAGVHPKVYIQMALCSTSEQEYDMYITDSTDLRMDDLAGQYVLTEDTVFLANKVYYTKSGTDNYYRYTKATVETGATVPANTYYNLTTYDYVHNSTTAGRFDLCQRTASVDPPSLSEGVITHNFTKGVLALKDPYKIWEGCLNLAMVNGMSYTKPSTTEDYDTYDTLVPTKTAHGYPALPFCPRECLDATSINYFVCDIYDRAEKKLFKVKMPAIIPDFYNVRTTAIPVHVYGQCCYYPADLAYLEIDLRLQIGTSSSTTEDNSIMMVFAKSGASSQMNARFDLRTVYIC